jgi:pyruvate, water dikinase
MDRVEHDFSTGIHGLDDVLCGLRAGDNVVWQVGSIDDFRVLVAPYLETALRQKRNITYFRFAKHPPLVEPAEGIKVVELDPQAGFEPFLNTIHRVIESAGIGAYYLFDSLSDLAADWYGDQMIGNFFQLTCPYLYELETVAYFALIRGLHSQFAMTPITETTQVLLEVYHYKGTYYVQPLKVQNRNSPQMYMLHGLDGDTAYPVGESHAISEIMVASPRSDLSLSQRQVGVWTRAFGQAQSMLQQEQAGAVSPELVRDTIQRLLRMAVSRDDRVLALAQRYFDLADMVSLGRRLLGTGLIGGKSVGMLLARAILEKSNPRWKTVLEAHDSFYIPSDVFYTFLVRNHCWAIRNQQLHSSDYLEGAEEARTRILAGTFPAHIEKRLADMLSYFGQAPIIVRSSSLLEDNFGNAFAGKYDSVFCTNQGSSEERLSQLISAIKTVYATAMSARALHYRARRGLLDRDEQMGLLIQRVSGARHGHLYFPQIAGVGFSFNPYVWNEDIDPEAGVIRLVFGLGTRAVDRSDDDYTRLIALNAPNRRPEVQMDTAAPYSQRRVDVLDLSANEEKTLEFTTVLDEAENIPMKLFSGRDRQLERLAREQGLRAKAQPVVRFAQLISKTAFVEDMQDMLRTLSTAYGCPVDIEFTANFAPDGSYKLNLVQCRPFLVRGNTAPVAAPTDIREPAFVLKTHGPVIGRSRVMKIDRIVYVVPSVYGQMPIKQRYAIARLIGKVMRAEEPGKPETVLLLGPGRWGTTTPSLGVPVSFAEISGVSVLCEIVAMREDLVPDVSLGTHFFSELVEVDMLYMALFPHHEGNYLNEELLESFPNRLCEIVPSAAPYANAVKVFDEAVLGASDTFQLYADTLKQETSCYVDGSDA